jgi:hypothetical protein
LHLQYHSVQRITSLCLHLDFFLDESLIIPN